MANPEHLKLIRTSSIHEWNEWRELNPDIKPSLNEINLEGKDLSGANLSWADLRNTNLSGSILTGANLNEAHLGWSNLTKTTLIKSRLTGSYLIESDLTQANLQESDLSGALLSGTILKEAHLEKAILKYARLVRTDLTGANISGAFVYGISAWNLKLEGLKQDDLIITRHDEPVVTVDDISVAQFIYLILNNSDIRRVIDTVGKKGVLILGRFSEERKIILDGIRGKLRNLGFLPILFDFERPNQRDFTETIKILAGLSLFIIADITNPKSSPLELQALIPNFMVPFVPIIQQGEKPFSMFQDLKQKHGDWVLDVLEYDSLDKLLNVFEKAIVIPAQNLSDKLLIKKSEEIRIRRLDDFS
jgi:hypothetical protein